MDPSSLAWSGGALGYIKKQQQKKLDISQIE